MNSTILFTAGAKGGSGKSTAARFLVTYLREQGADRLLLDLDDENRTLARLPWTADKSAVVEVK